MPLDPEEGCEREFKIQFDDQGRIRITDTELARAFVKQALSREGLDIIVDAAAGVIPLNPLSCYIPPKPINPCPDGMCPLSIRVRFGDAVKEQWASLPNNV